MACIAARRAAGLKRCVALQLFVERMLTRRHAVAQDSAPRKVSKMAKLASCKLLARHETRLAMAGGIKGVKDRSRVDLYFEFCCLGRAGAIEAQSRLAPHFASK